MDPATPHRSPTLLLACLGLALSLAGMAMADTYNRTETPHYTVLDQAPGIELRQYDTRLMAEVTVSGSRSQAANAGFRVLADYIFGGNSGAAKIAMTTPLAQNPVRIDMTTPVTQSPTGSGDGWVIQFAMPAGFIRDSLPRANNPAIRFVTLPAERMAVLRFSGLADGSTWEARTTALRDWITARGLTIQDGPRFFRYDPPWTMPWNRRNEVAFVVK